MRFFCVVSSWSTRWPAGSSVSFRFIYFSFIFFKTIFLFKAMNESKSTTTTTVKTNSRQTLSISAPSKEGSKVKQKIKTKKKYSVGNQTRNLADGCESAGCSSRSVLDAALPRKGFGPCWVHLFYYFFYNFLFKATSNNSKNELDKKNPFDLGAIKGNPGRSTQTKPVK